MPKQQSRQGLAELASNLIQLNERLKAARHRDRLKNLKWNPTQAAACEAYNDPLVHTVIVTGANQSGKSEFSAGMCCASLRGEQPWDGKLRTEPPVNIAFLVEDFDSHATKICEQNFWRLVPPDDLKVVARTQQGAPRKLEYLPTKSTVTFFTRGQDEMKKEGAIWHEMYIDEPCDQEDYISISRGLQQTNGKIIITATLISEPWIWEEIYSESYLSGGQNRGIAAFNIPWFENLKSRGGHIDDQGAENFWAKLSPEQLEARKYGRSIHLSGRIIQNFDPKVHVLERLPPDAESSPRGIVVDPHDGRPFAIAWFYVLPGNDIVFYEEWPRELFKDLRYIRTIDQYVEIMKAYGPCYYRYMDPNYGQRRSNVTGRTIAEEFQVRSVAGFPLAFDTSVLDDLDAGHAAVRQKLDYDRDRELGADNQPHLFVTSNCQNIIKSFQNYTWDDAKARRTGRFKPREDYKHFMDLVRYTVMMNPQHYAMPKSVFEIPEHSYSYGWEAHRSFLAPPETQIGTRPKFIDTQEYHGYGPSL